MAGPKRPNDGLPHALAVTVIKKRTKIRSATTAANTNHPHPISPYKPRQDTTINLVSQHQHHMKRNLMLALGLLVLALCATATLAVGTLPLAPPLNITS